MGLIENRDAQFMLLAGFIIGIGLVITTVMLNSVIFEGNMAVGAGTEPSKNDIINLIQITNDETRAAYRNAINISVPTSLMIADFTRQTQNFSDNLSTIYALHGEGVNLSWDVSNWNNDIYPYFTDNGTAGGSANWTVIQNVKDSDIIVNITTFGGSFNITLINSTTDWINLTSTGNFTFKKTSVQPYSIVFINGMNNAGKFKITGNTSDGKAFIRARDYILYANETFSTSRMRADFTIPISVPW
ncbi:conserved hypothetical protein [Candidatus Methanoperedens nitroreducens]|uniref:Uncharacterized protein n=2 Tax=Candidatus Methanoperedens nitratireducens TaxID=1392998 RepID=A0A284VR23_9EURY|nr:conserved hypothetical protein [Candidatus Methanoperedens nitroreducens]